MKLSIVIPAHNEEENISQVIEQVEEKIKFLFDLIVVNDHSSDRTAEIVSGLTKRYGNLIMIENRLKSGFANAIKTGLLSARTEVAVPVMGDLCDDLDSVPLMFKKIVEEGFDVVCGSRYIKGGARLGGSRVKGFFSYFVGRTMAMFTGIPTHDVANAFKMYRREIMDSVNIESTGFEVSMEIALKAYFKGFKVTEIPTVWKERERGKSTFKMLNLTPNYFRWYWWAARKGLGRLFCSFRARNDK